MSTITSRQAERFARLIELDAPVLDGTELSAPVTVAAALRAAGRTSPPAPLSEDARLAMRQRLVAAANVQAASLESPTAAASPTKTIRRRLARRATAIVGSVAVVTSISGVGVAAAHSLPGSPFYDIKRATEAVQLWVASGAHEKGERHLQFARTRLAEARALGADSPHVASTLRSMNEETRAGSSDLITAYQSSGQDDPLADLVVFTRQQYADLVSFDKAVGDRFQAQTFYSLTLLTGVAQQVQSVSGTTCLSCLVKGRPHLPPVPGASSTPTGTASPRPTATTPAASPTTSGSSRPTPKPTDLLPTGLLPTKLPTKLPTLPPLLGGKHDGKKTDVVPTLSPLPLLSTLTNLLTGR